MSEDNEPVELPDEFETSPDTQATVPVFTPGNPNPHYRKPLLIRPEGNVADLLEQQVGVCAALIGNIAEYVAGSVNPDVCFPFMDRIARLMSSSAKAGRIVGQLRGIVTETRQTFVKRKEKEGVNAQA
jgi:hypothetical protein